MPIVLGVYLISEWSCILSAADTSLKLVDWSPQPVVHSISVRTTCSSEDQVECTMGCVTNAPSLKLLVPTGISIPN